MQSTAKEKTPKNGKPVKPATPKKVKKKKPEPGTWEAILLGIEEAKKNGLSQAYGR